MGYDGIPFIEKKDSVVSKITIPMYFDKVIVPDMPDYYSDYTVDFELRPVVKCPLHGEDTPSLRYYEETNTYFCFGCRSGGDVIQLHREFMRKCKDTEVSFREAVDWLYGVFLGNSEKSRAQVANAGIHKVLVEKGQQVKEKESLNSNVDLMKFDTFARRFESMMLNSNMSCEDKCELYSYMDEGTTLIRLGLERVGVFENDIKNRCREKGLMLW